MPVDSTDLRIELASDRSLIVYFGEQIELHTHERVRKFVRLLEREPIAGVRNVQPAYCSVLLDFDPLKLSHEDLATMVRDAADRLDAVVLPAPREVEIPTCYGNEFGPDLDEVARLHGMAPGRVAELHASALYIVYFLGFVPGFGYMGGLPPELETPRLGTPRRAIAAGSVGIADNQTGVYPVTTPGGWRIIGRTPLVMFRAERPDMSYLEIGDHVRFVAISTGRFAELARQ